MDLNRITILGNVSQAPEQRKLASGATVTTINVATGHSWKDSSSGDKKEKVNFHTVVAWNKLGDTMQKYLKKGDRLYVEGRVDNRSYEGKDGSTKYATDVVAHRMIMLGGKTKTAATIEVEAEETNQEENPF